MWFTNLCAWRLRDADALPAAEDLATRLEEKAFIPCGPHATESIGWVAPAHGVHEALVHTAMGRDLICIQIESKVLPASVVRDFVEDEIEELQNQQQRKLRAAERQEIKERVTLELLPRAFTRTKRIHALVDRKAGWILINASSPRQAETLTGFLRETVGTLPITPILTKAPPHAAFGRWLAGEEPGFNFALANNCELREPGDGGAVVRVTNFELLSPEVQQHLQGGLNAVKVGVNWDEKIDLQLADDLIMRRLRFSETLEIDDGDDDPAARFDADFALMSETLLSLVDATLQALGGEAMGLADTAEHLAAPASAEEQSEATSTTSDAAEASEPETAEVETETTDAF